MKKSFVPYLLLCALVVSIPLQAAETPFNQPIGFVDRLRTLQASATQSMKSAGSIIKQKAHCLVDYSACTSRDKIAISTAFGFIMGFGFMMGSDFRLKPIFKPIIDRVLEKGGVTSELVPEAKAKDILGSMFISTIAIAMAEEVGLTGPLFMRRAAGIPGMISGGLASAPNKGKWIADMQSLFRGAGKLEKFIFLVVVAIEAYSILKEVAYAVQYKNKSPFMAISSYLKMNAKCIWDEKYCMPQKNAELRRLGLYFWLGYLNGFAARKLEEPFRAFWSRRGPASSGGGGKPPTTGYRLGRG